jgi:hypothetical protein
MLTPTLNLHETSPVTRAAPSRKSAWKRAGGFATGVLLALSGLLLAAAAAVSYGQRAAAGQLAGEPALALGLRAVGGLCLVAFGFTVMVLCSRSIDAQAAPTADSRTELSAAIAGEELLCGRCGAANDHLARFCDQCGRRL